MKLVTLGTQGLRVPAVGLGCMGMSDFYGGASDADNLRVLARAADIGCTFWDTSDMYGPFTNEILLSKALDGRRDQITLATKFGVSRREDGSYEGIKGNADYVAACCDASLKRLRTDHIDLYFQHRVDPKTPIEETVGAMADLVNAGKVRYLGRPGHHRARARCASNQRRSNRVFGLDARRGSRDSADAGAARHRVCRLQPAGSRLSLGGHPLARRPHAR